MEIFLLITKEPKEPILYSYMKITLLAIALLLTFQITAQEVNIQSKIDFFNSKIQQTEKGERLLWLDSLTSLTYNKPELKYDSIARQSINFAISIDSLDSAAGNVTDLIGYLNHHNPGSPKQGIILFNNYYNKLRAGAGFKRLGYLCLNVADSYYFTGNLDKSFEYYERAKAFGLKAKSQRLYGLALLYIGYNQSETGQLPEASQSFVEASRIFTKLNDTIQLIKIKDALANLYGQNAFYKKAKIERDEAIILANKINSAPLIRNLYFNAASDNSNKNIFSTTVGDDRFKNEIADEIANLKKSLLADRKTSYVSIEPFILSSLVRAYVQSDSLILAANKFKEIEQLWLNAKTDKNKARFLVAKSWILLGKGDYKNAIKYGLEILELQKEKSIVMAHMMAEKFLGDTYKLNNDVPNSNKHLLNFYTIKDSISSVQNVRSLSYYQTLYETEKQGLKIEKQESDIAILDAKNHQKNDWLLFGGLGLLSVFFFVTIHKSKNTAKKEKKQQEKFSQNLLLSQEEERIRIARELHDSVGQQLTLIKIRSQKLAQEEISIMANNALEEVRSISRDLYPVLLKQLGLTDSIEQLINDYDEQTDLFFSIDIDNVNNFFTENTSLNFYRLIQECLTNIVKHAKAKSVTINIKKENNNIVTLISDNGLGFDVNDSKKKNSLGLKTIFERIRILNGNISLDSQLNKGTNFIFSIPLKNE
tara:strand:- start:1249 stop:3369 length:2121 start_codon:yes stop_codon:yes gene_type:complete